MKSLSETSFTPSILWRRSDQKVYLTFDDGPDANITPRILDLLDSLGIKATFFMIGQKVRQNGNITRRIQESGHAIGNHTYDHPSLLGKSRSVIYEQLAKTDAVLEDATGNRPHYFRPPHGRFGVSVLRVLRQTGHRMVLWSRSTRDYRKEITPTCIKQTLTNNAKPGSILLLHDGHPNSFRTLLALQETLSSLKEGGTVFSSLPDYD